MWEYPQQLIFLPVLPSHSLVRQQPSLPSWRYKWSSWHSNIHGALAVARLRN